MKAARIRELTHEELARKQGEVSKELFEARLEAATGQLGHTHKVRMLRRQLARLNTIRRERELDLSREGDASREGGASAS